MSCLPAAEYDFDCFGCLPSLFCSSLVLFVLLLPFLASGPAVDALVALFRSVPFRVYSFGTLNNNIPSWYKQDARLENHLENLTTRGRRVGSSGSRARGFASYNVAAGDGGGGGGGGNIIYAIKNTMVMTTPLPSE